MKVTFDFTQSFRQDQFKHGSQRPKTVTKDLPLPSLSEETRQFIIEINPLLDDLLTLQLDVPYENGAGTYNNNQTVRWEASFDPQDPAQWDQLFAAFKRDRDERIEQNALIIHEHLLDLIEKMKQLLAAPEITSSYKSLPFIKRMEDYAIYPEAQALFKQLETRYHEAQDEQKRLQAEQEAKRRAEKERIEADKERWIHEQGSPMLRAKFDAGYNCQRDYVLERAATEYPGYTVDFNDEASWEERSCPSDAAFREADHIKGTVVYLTKEPSNALPTTDDDEYDNPFFEPGEAVVLRSYLGKYDLVRKM